MMRHISAMLGIAVLTALALPSAAFAVDGTDYTPDTNVTPTLAGSTAIPACDSDAAWIDYSVTLTDPADTVGDAAATLVVTGDANTTTVPLGNLQNDALSGRVPWPAAAEDAWTRGPISAEIRVAPDLGIAVPLSYPKSSPDCMAGPASAAGSIMGLPATGTSAPILPISIAGIVVVAGGLVMLGVRRRAHVDR